MLTIELDGIYCKECNDFHPTLYWHKAYDDYLDTKENAVPKYTKMAATFGKNITAEEALALHFENMRIKGLEYCQKTGKCIICKKQTQYMLISTKEYVCSDKCKYQAE